MREIIERMPCTEANLMALAPDVNFLIWSPSGYWGEPMGGSTLRLPFAHVYTRDWNVIEGCHPSDTAEIHLFREVEGTPLEEPPQPELPVQPPPKSNIEHLLSHTVLELLKAAPLNPIARAHALNDLKQAIPDKCLTFEEIKAWAEETIPPRGTRPPTSPSGGGVVLEQITERANRTAFTIGVDVSETEIGRATYTGRMYGSGRIAISREEMEEAVENSDTLDGVADYIGETIETKANDEIGLEVSDDGYNYENEETIDCRDHDVGWDGDRLRLLIRDWLANNNPDRLAELEF